MKEINDKELNENDLNDKEKELKESKELFDAASHCYESAKEISLALDTAAELAVAAAANEIMSVAIASIESIYTEGAVTNVDEFYNVYADDAVYQFTKLYEVTKAVTRSASKTVEEAASFYEDFREQYRAASEAIALN